MEDKQIRFIDPHYHNLFTVPDGGNVVINRYDGERVVTPCKYLDETHVRIGNYDYHICEFAEKMAAAGNTYEPEIPEKVENYTIFQRMDFDDRKGIVLGHNAAAPEPFVTWEFNERYGERRYADGRYRKRLTTAQKDFDDRCAPRLASPYTKMVYQFDHTDRVPKGKAPQQQDKPTRPKSTSEPSR